MQHYSEQVLSDLAATDEALVSFLLETTSADNKYWELEEYVSDLREQI